MTEQPITLSRAESDADIAEVARLFRAYEADTGLDLCFQNFEEEIATLPGKYAPPKGDLLLARDANGSAVGCAAFRPLVPGACEFKRLYVDPAMRGKRVGDKLVAEILARGAAVGYREIRLDTLETMQAAIALYRKVGFTECAPYYENPLPGVVYLSKPLL